MGERFLTETLPYLLLIWVVIGIAIAAWFVPAIIGLHQLGSPAPVIPRWAATVLAAWPLLSGFGGWLVVAVLYPLNARRA